MLGHQWVEDAPGGLNRYVADLAEALRRADAPVAEVLLGPAERADGLVSRAADRRGLLPARVGSYGLAASRAAVRCDVVDAHFALYSALAARLPPLRSRPLVVHFHGPWAQEVRVTRGDRGRGAVFRSGFEHALYRRATRLVTLSEAFRQLLVDCYGVDASRVEVIPPGVDLERFRSGSRVEARMKLAVNPDRFVAAAVRRHDPRMGLDVLLASWRRVAATVPGALLLIAGGGPESPRLQSQARDLVEAGSVRFLGRVADPDLPDLYRAADCSVVPSRALEGFGLVTLESLACGTAAVVTDVGGLPDGVKGLGPGLVVPPEDVESLARRLVRAAHGELPGPDECRRHAERFTWDAAAERHIALYADLAGGAVSERSWRMRDPGATRVVYLDHVARWSGGEVALARQLPALRARGVEPVVVVGEEGPLVARLRDESIPVRMLPMPPALRDRRRDDRRIGFGAVRTAAEGGAYMVRLVRLLRRERPDLVHTNSLKTSLVGGTAARLAGIPVVWHLRDRLAADYMPGPVARFTRIVSWILPTAVVANSAATRASLPWGVMAAVVPSPIDPELLEVPARYPAERTLSVTMLGRLAPWKGQEVFLRAFADAFPVESARAVVAGAALFGEDEYATGLVDLAHELGIAGRVDFRGHVTDLASLLAESDIVVHASTVAEPFGLVVVEAMAAGRAVVATAAGGPAEVIRPGADGLLVPPNDASSLAEALRRLAGDPELRALLGAGARDAGRRYRPEDLAPSLIAVYRWVLG